MIKCLPPVIYENSEILILGSIPGVVSLKAGFYYQNKGNRFWKMLAHCFKVPIPAAIGDQKRLLKTSKIALWDVAESCEREGSMDSDIKNAEFNDIASLVKNYSIKRIFLNGKKAAELFNKIENKPEIEIIELPSMSGANRKYAPDGKLFEEWSGTLRL